MIDAAWLDATTLAQLPRDIERPRYDLDRVGIGVAHLGPGAFHRAHQAWYFDDVLARDPRWGISAVSLKSAALRDALEPQDGLYTVAMLDASIRYRVIGSLRERLVAAADRERVFARLSAPDTRIVSLTITEKGYCLGADGALDFNHPDIANDLAAPSQPASAIGYLVEGLRRRRADGLMPFTTISCDNLSDNGGKLGRAVVAFARASDPGLASWIESEAAFPRTMVDSIVPATDTALKHRVALALGRVDRWPVQREAFAQWVIEDRFCNDAPDWAALGVTVSGDVAAFERAKLRLLNGAHSTLAYLGLLAGHATVADAMRDAPLATFVERMMREDIQPAVAPPSGFDVGSYIDDVLKRFRNPAMQHALAQIAWDGSQKLPFRILATVRDALAAQRPVERLCVPIAAWLHFVRRAQRDAREIVDPLRTALFAVAGDCNGDAGHDVPRFFALAQVFGDDLRRNTAFVTALSDAYDRIALGS
ncbi:MAG TPA: mannitol dehydrogenase family protein [Rudaea sp.]|nr:mannitol dehydrogenase family protein [Rudaea sp.]